MLVIKQNQPFLLHEAQMTHLTRYSDGLLEQLLQAVRQVPLPGDEEHEPQRHDGSRQERRMHTEHSERGQADGGYINVGTEMGLDMEIQAAIK